MTAQHYTAYGRTSGNQNKDALLGSQGRYENVYSAIWRLQQLVVLSGPEAECKERIQQVGKKQREWRRRKHEARVKEGKKGDDVKDKVKERRRTGRRERCRGGKKRKWGQKREIGNENSLGGEGKGWKQANQQEENFLSAPSESDEKAPVWPEKSNFQTNGSWLDYVWLRWRFSVWDRPHESIKGSRKQFCVLKGSLKNCVTNHMLLRVPHSASWIIHKTSVSDMF